MKKIIVSIMFILSLLSINVYGVFSFNETCEAFPNQCSRDGGEGYRSRSSSPLLGELITIGASHFLKSNSDFHLFLEKIELSDYGINFVELQTMLDRAIFNMELVNASYYEIWQTSLNLDYNPIVLEKLKQFNFVDYQSEYGLNPSVFLNVFNFLKTGNVKGAYEWFYNATGEILQRLKKVKTMVDAKIMPKIPDLWRINQMFLELELFGQYVSEVFYTVSKMQ